jgi:hypothetical protein
MTVGVSKNRVKVITQGTASSIEEEKDVYVVNTTDPALLLATSAELSSSTDLTGNVTIGSDVNSQVVIGSGSSSDVTIGSIGNSSSAKLEAQNIILGSGTGNHNIYIGETSTNSSDSIHVGTSPLSTITIGTNGGLNNANSAYLNSRAITVGTRSGSSASTHTELTLQGNNITTKATTNYDLKAQGTVVLVANDESLNGSGTRTYASLGNAAASLTHVDSSNAIQASTYLNAGKATLFGITEAKLDSDTAAVVESPATSIVGTTEATISSPSTSIEYKSIATQNGFGNTAYQVNGYNTTSSQGPSSKAHKGTIDLLAAQVTTNSTNTEIIGYSKASQISMSPDSAGRNIYARSASGILLRSNDSQLNNAQATQNGWYAELNNKVELGQVVDGVETPKVSVNSIGVSIEGGLTTISADSLAIINSKNSVSISGGSIAGETSGNISLSAHSEDINYGDITALATNDISLTASSGDITLTASNGYITELADNEMELYSNDEVVIHAGTHRYESDSPPDTFRKTEIWLTHNTLVLSKINRANDPDVNVSAGFGSFSDPAIGNRFVSTSGFYAVDGGYTPFTGVHIFDIQPDSNISIGDAVIAVNRTAMLTTTPNDKRCIGIVCEILENNKVSVASVGDNECGALKGFKVCNENGIISAGDLLTTSSTAGYLMKQSDDIMRSSTVGKSAVDVVFDANNKAIDVYGFIYCG